MIRKHIAHLAAESLKFFFNIDHTLCSHLFVTILVAVSLLKLSIDNIGHIFQDGIVTVREDLVTIKAYLNIIRDRIQKAELVESFSKRTHRITSNLSSYLTANQ